MGCIFCALIQEQVPRWVVYEDAEVIAFLLEHPEAFGHSLVVPGAHE